MAVTTKVRTTRATADQEAVLGEYLQSIGLGEYVKSRNQQALASRRRTQERLDTLRTNRSVELQPLIDKEKDCEFEWQRLQDPADQAKLKFQQARAARLHLEASLDSSEESLKRQLRRSVPEEVEQVRKGLLRRAEDLMLININEQQEQTGMLIGGEVERRMVSNAGRIEADLREVRQAISECDQLVESHPSDIMTTLDQMRQRFGV